MSNIKRHGTSLEREALRDAARHINSLIAAANGDESRCASFSTTFAPRPHDHEGEAEYAERLRQYYMRQVRIYVESWIQPTVNAVYASMTGEPSSEDTEILRAVWRS